MRSALVIAFVFLFASPTQPQQAVTPPSKDTCLEKEIADFTRIIDADGERLKIGFLAEHVTWSDDYRRAAIDVIQSQFSNSFVAAPDQTLGVLVLYISGTSVVASGAQFVNVRLQLNSSEILLPENAKTLLDIHPAKIGDPTRVMSGQLVFADEGVLLPPIGQMQFELWHQLNIQNIRETIKKVLSAFLADWEKAAKR